MRKRQAKARFAFTNFMFSYKKRICSAKRVFTDGLRFLGLVQKLLEKLWRNSAKIRKLNYKEKGDYSFWVT